MGIICKVHVSSTRHRIGKLMLDRSPECHAVGREHAGSMPACLFCLAPPSEFQLVLLLNNTPIPSL